MDVPLPSHLEAEARYWLDRPYDQSKYREYLRSDLWRWVRALVRQRSGGMCERCRRRTGQQVHHIHYSLCCKEWLDLSCLQFCCEKCHSEVHDLGTQDHAADWEYLARLYRSFRR